MIVPDPDGSTSAASVPYPTLYTGNGLDPPRPKSTIELILFNIARQLASVATGYDVGLSNVMPYNPKMDPVRSDEEVGGPGLTWYEPGAQERRPRGHNTYHGPAPHHRAPLPGLATPLRFAECPQVAGAGRRPSRAEEEDVAVQPPPPVATGPGLDRPLYVPPPDYNDPGPGYTMARTARYYHDQREGEREAAQLLYQPYKDSPRRAAAVPEAGLATAYTNPGYEQLSGSRGPGRVTFGHRRTPSGSSATYRDQYGGEAGGGSGPSSAEFSCEGEGVGRAGPPLVPRRLSRQGSYGSEMERPQTLELGGGGGQLTPRTPLRSSLKKYNYSSYQQPKAAHWTPGWGSGGGTPTNETNSSSDEVGTIPGLCYPPSKSDSGFVSSGRLASVAARFSPVRGADKVTDWSPTGVELGGSTRDIGTR